RLVATALESFGTLTTLVNNVGIAQQTPRDTWDVDPEVWDRVIRVNLRSVYTCSRAAIPAIVDAGGGSIVSIASIAASVCVGGAGGARRRGGGGPPPGPPPATLRTSSPGATSGSTASRRDTCGRR